MHIYEIAHKRMIDRRDPKYIQHSTQFLE